MFTGLNPHKILDLKIQYDLTQEDNSFLAPKAFMSIFGHKTQFAGELDLIIIRNPFFKHRVALNHISYKAAWNFSIWKL